MAGTKPCGQHKELMSNTSLRITQCACGMIHVTIYQNGLTLRMTPNSMRSTLAGMKTAMDQIDEEAVPSFGSSTIN